MNVLPRLLYGLSHPYGRPGSSRMRPNPGTVESVKAISRGDVVSFYEKVFNPANATLIVVGDTTPTPSRRRWRRRLATGKPPPDGRELPQPPAPPQGVTIYLVDKPGAPQTFISVGEIGLPRKTPGLCSLSVLNAVLGGQFSSRLNLNLREDKGYTYGAFSAYGFRVGPGPFTAGAAVQTDVTKPALAELVRGSMRSSRLDPSPAKELTSRRIA